MHIPIQHSGQKPFTAITPNQVLVAIPPMGIKQIIQMREYNVKTMKELYLCVYVYV